MDDLTDEGRRIEARRFDLAMRRLLAGDLTEAEAVELDEINARLSATIVRPTSEAPEEMQRVEAMTLVGARRRCEKSGNPSGTDTWPVGSSCPCRSCRAWMRDHAGAVLDDQNGHPIGPR